MADFRQPCRSRQETVYARCADVGVKNEIYMHGTNNVKILNTTSN